MQSALFSVLRCDLAQAEGTSQVSMGWPSLTPVLMPLFPTCCSVRVACHPLSGDGDGRALTRWAVPGPGCPVPPATLSCTPGAGGHRGTEVAICRFCCTGTARAWLSPLGSGPSGVCSDLARVTGHCSPASQPLVSGGMSLWSGFPGDRAGSPFPFRPCCSCPAPPTLPLGQDVPPALPVGLEVLASGTKPSVTIHRAPNKGAPSH